MDNLFAAAEGEASPGSRLMKASGKELVAMVLAR